MQKVSPFMRLARNGDVEIYYETFGSPNDPALLLYNGLGSHCINYRVEWCERFVQAGHFVIRFDNSDVGLSTKFADFEPDLAGMARAGPRVAPSKCPTCCPTWHATHWPCSTRSRSTAPT